MAREQAVAARKERNTALVEVMMLAVAADGEVNERALQTVLRRIIERREFEGTRPEELKAMLEGSVKRLASAKSLESILKSLRDRLPDHRNRMLAFGLAAAVAFADNRATRNELGLLKTFQAALGIAEDEVAQIISVVEEGGSLAEALGEPAERLYAEVMVLVSAAGGELREAESRALVETLVADPIFENVSPERAQSYVSAAVAALVSEGLPRRLRVLAQGLTTHPQRLRAFKLAMQIANAGRATAQELKTLELLQATFGLADDEIDQIRAEL